MSINTFIITYVNGDGTLYSRKFCKLVNAFYRHSEFAVPKPRHMTVIITLQLTPRLIYLS